MNSALSLSARLDCRSLDLAAGATERRPPLQKRRRRALQQRGADAIAARPAVGEAQDQVRHCCAARRSLEASKKAKEEHFIYRTQLQPGGYIKTRILNRLARSDLLLAKVNIKQSKAGALITYKVPEIKAAVLEQWPKEWPTLTLPAEESQSDDTVEQAVEAAAE